jgi:hypothetical protein
MSNPILNRLEIKPLTIRRQMLDPGTMLVFQLPDNRLEAPPQGFSITDMLKKRPKFAFTVDVRAHTATFDCQLPAKGDAVYFSATVNYSWMVADPARVVSQQVSNPEGDCYAYLSQVLPQITRRHEFEQPAAAEEDLHRTRAGRSLELPQRGLRILDVYMHLRISDEQRDKVAQLSAIGVEQRLAVKRVENEADLADLAQAKEIERQEKRRHTLEALIAGGTDRLYAFVIQQDPTKGLEVISRMDAMEEQKRQYALEQMKVLIDGGQVRLGDLDDAVADAVANFRSILGKFKTDDKKKPALTVESSVGDPRPSVESAADPT